MKRLLLLFLLLLLPSLAWAKAVSYVSYDGIDDYAISSPSSGSSPFNIATNAVWWGWIYPVSVPDATVGNGHRWLAKYDAANGKRSWNHSLVTGGAGTAVIRFQYSTDGASTGLRFLDATTTMTLNAWHFVTIEYQYAAGGSGITMFVDGVQTGTSNVATGPIYQGSSGLYIGTMPVSGTPYGDFMFDGRIGPVGFAAMDVLPENLCGIVGHQWMYQNPGFVYSGLSGASRYFAWGPSGSYAWPSGTWAETGVSTGKTQGQFDMRFYGRPQAYLWKPSSLWDWAVKKFESWRIFKIP
jgi:hypothetical protein